MLITHICHMAFQLTCFWVLTGIFTKASWNETTWSNGTSEQWLPAIAGLLNRGPISEPGLSRAQPTCARTIGPNGPRTGSAWYARLSSHASLCLEASLRMLWHMRAVFTTSAELQSM